MVQAIALAAARAFARKRRILSCFTHRPPVPPSAQLPLFRDKSLNLLVFRVLRTLPGPPSQPQSMGPVCDTVRLPARAPRLPFGPASPATPGTLPAPARQACARSRSPPATNPGTPGVRCFALQYASLSLRTRSVCQAPLQRDCRFSSSQEARSRPPPNPGPSCPPIALRRPPRLRPTRARVCYRPRARFGRARCAHAVRFACAHRPHYCAR